MACKAEYSTAWPVKQAGVVRRCILIRPWPSRRNESQRRERERKRERKKNGGQPDGLQSTVGLRWDGIRSDGSSTGYLEYCARIVGWIWPPQSCSDRDMVVVVVLYVVEVSIAVLGRQLALPVGKLALSVFCPSVPRSVDSTRVRSRLSLRVFVLVHFPGAGWQGRDLITCERYGEVGRHLRRKEPLTRGSRITHCVRQSKARIRA